MGHPVYKNKFFGTQDLTVESSMQAPAEVMKCDMRASAALCCAPQGMFLLYTAVAIVRSNVSSTACRIRAVVVRASTLAVLQLLLITSTRRISKWTNPYLRFAEIRSLYFCALRGRRYGLKNQSRTEARLHTLSHLQH